MISSAVAALTGSVVLFTSILWISWKESLTSEEAYVGGLATALGKAAEHIIFDTRDMLGQFNDLPASRCSPEHVRAMQKAGVSRPYVRAIGYWRANERLCGIGFLAQDGLKPEHADRIYDNGVVAWWPSSQTEVGGTKMFLMRYGDHDAAIDPRMLLELGPTQDRKAVLWVERLRMSAVPLDVALPVPESLPIGVSVDHMHGVVFSRFAQNSILPIEVVASEPLNRVVSRHAQTLLTGAGFGLLMVGLWCYFVVRFSRYELSMAAQLRKALAAGEIYVEYQPVVDMVSGDCVGAEALARWKLDDQESIGPATFIPSPKRPDWCRA